jgi:hypothetical protein
LGKVCAEVREAGFADADGDFGSARRAAARGVRQVDVDAVGGGGFNEVGEEAGQETA